MNAMDPNLGGGYYQPQQQPQFQQPMQPMQMTPQPSYQQQQTTVVIQQPTQPTSIPQNSREWSHGLCGCCEDLGECCFAYWCPCCHWCSLSSRMGEYYCGPYAPPCGCYELFRVGMRVKIRTMYGIRGSICEDACCVCCCPCCVAVQIAQELKAYGNF